jgi:hypothetical protein
LSSRTLYSVWHDHALTYFAWDDFTPGQPGIRPDGTTDNFTINFVDKNGDLLNDGDNFKTLLAQPLKTLIRWNITSTSAGGGLGQAAYALNATDTNSGWQYLNDAFEIPIISAELTDGGTPADSVATTLAPGTTRYDWDANISGVGSSATSYTVQATAKFKNAKVAAESPPLTSYGETNAKNSITIHITKLYSTSVRIVSSINGGGCYTLGSNFTAYPDKDYFNGGHAANINYNIYADWGYASPPPITFPVGYSARYLQDAGDSCAPGSGNCYVYSLDTSTHIGDWLDIGGSLTIC